LGELAVSRQKSAVCHLPGGSCALTGCRHCTDITVLYSIVDVKFFLKQSN
jgi:hypothetical protein